MVTNVANLATVLTLSRVLYNQLTYLTPVLISPTEMLIL